MKWIKKKKSSIKDKNKQEIVPKREPKILAIILRETHGIKYLWVRNSQDSFSLDKNFYFIEESGMYISENSIRTLIYLEGISTPLTHKHIDRETVKKFVKMPTGETIVHQIEQIKGLKWDAKIIYMLLNRKLADVFLRPPVDTSGFILILMLILLVVLNCVNIYLGAT